MARPEQSLPSPPWIHGVLFALISIGGLSCANHSASGGTAGGGAAGAGAFGIGSGGAGGLGQGGNLGGGGAGHGGRPELGTGGGGSGALGGSDGGAAGAVGGAAGATGGNGARDGGIDVVGLDAGSASGGRVGTTDACQPILNQAGMDTGFESCADGAKRRRAAIVCPTEQTSASSPCGADPLLSCKADSDCKMQPNGYCADAHKLTGYCGCYYGCRQDSDCGAGSICECGVVVGRCVAATCTTNADCGVGFGCASATAASASVATCINGFGAELSSTYTCQTPADQCQGDSICPPNGRDRGACFLDGGRRVCGTICFMPV